MTGDEQQIEIAAAVMSQYVHRLSRRLGYFFTGEFDTATCDVCRKQAARAFHELERLRSVTTGKSE